MFRFTQHQSNGRVVIQSYSLLDYLTIRPVTKATGGSE